MTDTDAELVFECTLDAPLEKVWRALTIPEYLERWLQPSADLDLTVLAAEENHSLSYRWREAGSGGTPEDSIVTFELAPDGEGRTAFRLTHTPPRLPVAANSNDPAPTMMLLAA
ncbi:SRPBCC domain-containing protein [Devosia albogilva]|uniref:SRPBCC domain-containing protein n=1 Tax=Devosia albogilva TaxID=429726 RepID=A0ABW5QFI9_9HYPH